MVTSKEVAEELKKIEEISKKETLVQVQEKQQVNLKEIYEKIVSVLKYYMDIKEEYYSIIALWIIGTYFHKDFSSFPYLYFNAMRGSGKSRVLRLISKLAWNGEEPIVSMSEAVLFRTASQGTICIDEFEQIGSREKQALRELLNSAYKKGGIVKRAYKRKGMDREKIEIERFDVYTPIVICNIWGMDNVLGDRCISTILEKSDDKSKTRLNENFDNNEMILEIKRTFTDTTYTLDSGNHNKQIENAWNLFVKEYYRSVSSVSSVYSVNSVNSVNHNLNDYRLMFEKIVKTDIDSRNLELFFPLFILADKIDILEEIIKIAEEIIEEKKEQDIQENKDISLIEFISLYDKIKNEEFVSVKELLKEFREFLELSEREADYINSSWIGRALRRLNLIRNKRSTGKHREVILNIDKAKKKIKTFKSAEELKQELEREREQIKIERIEDSDAKDTSQNT